MPSRPPTARGAPGVTYFVVESRYGHLYVAESPAGILLAKRATSVTAFEREIAAAFGHAAMPSPDPAPSTAMYQRWLEGNPPSETRLDLEALPSFTQAALRRTAEIPLGEVRPYEWVAKEIGRPAAARAVGSALGRNPIALLIPCHRVVSGDGSVGPYGRSGERTKRALLECEGVDVARLDAFARSGIRFLGDASTEVVCYPTCRCAREAKPEHLVPFGSVDRAIGEGYVACRRCRPCGAPGRDGGTSLGLRSDGR